MLVHVVDCATFEPGRDPVSDVDALEEELARYTPALGGDLADRPRMVVLNKIDVPDARTSPTSSARRLEARGLPVFEISTASREGLRELTFAMAEVVRGVPRRPADEGIEPDRAAADRRRRRRASPSIEDPEVEGGFIVAGHRPERWVRQTNFDNDEAVGYLADRLARLGVEDALAKTGAVPAARSPSATWCSTGSRPPRPASRCR